jgi:hypothetical protein
MSRPRKRRPNGEVKVITLNSPVLVTELVCDIKGLCYEKVKERDNEHHSRKVAARDAIESYLKEPKPSGQ